MTGGAGDAATTRNGRSNDRQIADQLRTERTQAVQPVRVTASHASPTSPKIANRVCRRRAADAE